MKIETLRRSVCTSMKKKISLIDFGAGNLHSVHKAFRYIGADVEITKDPLVIEKSDAVVFPGVGAFGATMASISKSKLGEVVLSTANSGKPFLGICMGMQVLFEESEESPGVKGFGVFKGKVVKFKKAKKIPHIGWNDISSQWSVVRSQKFYFVHSYYVVPEDKSIIFAETEYDSENFVSAIKKDNLLAVQFHPEKSGDGGLRFLESFLNNTSKVFSSL